VWRDSYWLPDEAASIYARAQAVISMECHSPLIALRSGTLAFYLRQPTDTCKGQMYRDFGAGEWMFEIDESDGKDWWKTLSVICADPGGRGSGRRDHARRRARQRGMVDAVRTAVAAGS
jgi:hypothetical protein